MHDSKYRETKEHGTFAFPMEFYHVGPAHPRYEMSCHWHVEYEIIRILQGRFRMTIEGEEIAARAGDIVFIRGGLLHGGVPEHCLYECMVFRFDSLMTAIPAGARILEKAGDDFIEIRRHFPAADRELTDIAGRMFGQMQRRGEGYELAVIGALYEFFGYVLQHGWYREKKGASAREGRRIGQLKKVIAVIEERYDECITLEELARAAGMNPGYFCRYFREMTQRTPIDYLNYYRIEQACIKLTDSDASVSEIGVSCGFSDESYFIKTFKKYKDVTPGKYAGARRGK